jgi:outer membrane protein assembly factor BamB
MYIKNIIVLVCGIFIISSCAHIRPDGRTIQDFSPIWSKNLDPHYDTGNLPIALQSPLIYEGLVYVGENSGSFSAYELENGRLVWSEKESSTYHAGAVGFKDQVIYGNVQGVVTSRQYLTGKIKYAVDLGASVETSGAIHQGRIFFQLRNHQVFALDIETGKILWAYKRAVPNLTTLQRASRPIVYKDKVIVGFADGALAALSLDEGTLLYEAKLANAAKFTDIDNVPFISNDFLYIGGVGSSAMILDPQNGKIIHRGDFISSCTPVTVQGQFFFGTPNGEIIMTDKKLNIEKREKISASVIASIVNFKNYLAVGTTDGAIFLLDPTSLKSMNHFSFGHSYSAIFGDLASLDNYLAILSSRNRLFVFKKH